MKHHSKSGMCTKHIREVPRVFPFTCCRYAWVIIQRVSCALLAASRELIISRILRRRSNLKRSYIEIRFFKDPFIQKTKPCVGLEAHNPNFFRSCFELTSPGQSVKHQKWKRTFKTTGTPFKADRNVTPKFPCPRRTIGSVKSFMFGKNSEISFYMTTTVWNLSQNIESTSLYKFLISTSWGSWTTILNVLMYICFFYSTFRVIVGTTRRWHTFVTNT